MFLMKNVLKTKILKFSSSPGSINQVSFGQDVGLWIDLLTQNDFSQKRLHADDLKDTESNIRLIKTTLLWSGGTTYLLGL